jgi:DNA ligase-1
MTLSDLATIYDAIAEAEGTKAKQEHLVDLLTALDENALAATAHLTVGELVAPVRSDRLRIGPGTVRDVLSDLSDQDPDTIEQGVREQGDLSLVAADVVGRANDDLTPQALWQRANRTVQRDEDRAGFLHQVYAHTSSNGAKYVTRMALDEMRIGVGHGTLLKAITAAFDVDLDAVQRLYAYTNDIGLTAVRARRGPRSLAQARLALFRPYRFMNAKKVEDIDEALDRLGETDGLYETKYDGARLQIHVKTGGDAEIRLYSRRLNDVTESLPDALEALRQAWRGGDAIVEGEAVAYDASLEQKQPFQAVMTRLGRKHDVEAMAGETPVVLFLFDVLYNDGTNLMDTPQQERRDRLRALFRSTRRVQLTGGHTLRDADAVQQRFDEAIDAGHEGLLAKDPTATYAPGQRTYRWMKLKPSVETLDVVVVGGIWGTGARKGLLSSLLVAVRDGDGYAKVGKVGTGFTMETLRTLTDTLEEQIVTTKGRRVDIEPATVIEVAFQDIQQTDTYGAGYALRMPRFKGERTDKSPAEADTRDRLQTIYDRLHG